MPMIEFKCQDCGQVYEDLVFSSDEQVPCPICKSTNAHRLISLISAKGIASGCTSCVPSQCSSKHT
ncbi:MAG: FmdB family zinc ribbon protein [bacterium]